jgi:hypothetical protein
LLLFLLFDWSVSLAIFILFLRRTYNDCISLIPWDCLFRSPIWAFSRCSHDISDIHLLFFWFIFWTWSSLKLVFASFNSLRRQTNLFVLIFNFLLKINIVSKFLILKTLRNLNKWSTADKIIIVVLIFQTLCLSWWLAYNN